MQVRDQGSSEPAEVLRSKGLRATFPRLAVLKAVDGRGHLDADAIGAIVRDESGPVATQTVYDVLAALTEVGLLRKIDPAGAASALYETRVGDNHHHLVCRNCRITFDVDCVVDARPCLTASDDYGFVIDEAEVTFWGLCPSCQQNNAV